MIYYSNNNQALQHDLDDLERQIESELFELENLNKPKMQQQQQINQIQKQTTVPKIMASYSQQSIRENYSSQISTGSSTCAKMAEIKAFSNNQNLFTIEDLGSQQTSEVSRHNEVLRQSEAQRRSKSPIHKALAKRNKNYATNHSQNQKLMPCFNSNNNNQIVKSSNPPTVQNVQRQEDSRCHEVQTYCANIGDNEENQPQIRQQFNTEIDEVVIDDNDQEQQFFTQMNGAHQSDNNLRPQLNQYSFYQEEQNENQEPNIQYQQQVQKQLQNQEKIDQCRQQHSSQGSVQKNICKQKQQQQQYINSKSVKKQVNSKVGGTGIINNSHRTKANDQHYLQQGCSFKPMLSKKSMEIAQYLDEPMKRLLYSKQKVQQQVNRLKSEIDNKYSFHPEVNEYPNYLLKKRDLSNCSSNGQNIAREQTGINLNLLVNQHQQSQYSQYSQSQIQQNQNLDASPQQPRWEKLYELNKLCQIDREVKKMQKEKQLEEDPNLTFQPKLYKSRSQIFGENEFGIVERNEYWVKKREDKLRKVRKQHEAREVAGCTFQPLIQKSVDESKYSEFQMKVSEFNKKGIIEFFERIDQANKKKAEMEELKMKQTGQTWQNKITVPIEFNFMKRDNSKSSLNSNPRTLVRASDNNYQDLLNGGVLRQQKQGYSAAGCNSGCPNSGATSNRIGLFSQARSKSSNNLLQLDQEDDVYYNANNRKNLQEARYQLHNRLMQMDLE